MHFFSEYGLFLAKCITGLIIILMLVAGIVFIFSKSKQKEKTGKLSIQNLNEKFDQYLKSIDAETSSSEYLKDLKKKSKKEKKLKKAKSLSQSIKKRLFVLNFIGDIKASAVASLREEITAILIAQRPNDEVLICIDSPGGVVHGYGLAAAQLERLKAAKVKLIVSVDKIAASGGYLMACQADWLMAAPLAIVGSIGVIAQIPNFHRWLDKNDVDFEQIQAGQYKRTLTMFGKNTTEGREKFQEEVNEVHDLFKQYIATYRPQLNVEAVATGEHWLGMRALGLKLIDEIKTSDDYLLNAREDFDIYHLKYEIKKSLIHYLNFGAKALLPKFLPKIDNHPGNYML